MKTSKQQQQQQHQSEMKRKSAKKKNGSKKKRKVINFRNMANSIKRKLSKSRSRTVADAIAVALKTAKKQKNKVKVGRVIRIPKTGGVLPLIPIFAGLSALGALGGGAAGIVKAVNEARLAGQELGEVTRHNKKMEAIAMGKGLFLKPYKKGLGLFLGH